MTTLSETLGDYSLKVSPTSVVLMLPIHTISESNARDHWAAKYRARSKPHRTLAMLALRQHVRALRLPVRVLLTRFSSGRLDDDNLRAALKAVRDGVADALGLPDDSDPRVSWFYEQSSAKRGSHAVEIAITRNEA